MLFRSLNEPPKAVVAANTVSPTIARDLVSALNDLLDAQNDLLNAWVSFEVLRMLLDFELGTMRLNDGGLWSDPGAILPPGRELPTDVELLPDAPEAAPAPPPLPEDRTALSPRSSNGWRATRSEDREVR